MKILIDGHMLGENEGGNERYIKDMSIFLIKNLDNKSEIKIAVSKKYYLTQKTFSKDNLIVIPFKNNFLRLLFFTIICYINKFDILHSTYISPFFLLKTNSIITVHDLSFKKYPQFYSLKENLIFNFLLPIALKNAFAIIVPSKFTKKEMIKYFPQYKNKIYVIYEAPNNCFFPIKRKKAKKIIKNKFKILKPFALTINSKNKKKNINKVIELLKNNLAIVVVGPKINFFEEKYKDKNIIFLKYVSDEDLNLLFNASKFFISLSLYEGFNLPIIEALKTQTPVIASDIPVHKELYNNSIIYYHDNEDFDSLNNRLKKSLTITKIKKTLSKYSWGNSAKKLLKIYKKATVK